MAPQLASSADGRVFLSWLEPGPEGSTRFRLAERSGDAWSALPDIVAGTNLFANWADVPTIFAARDGRLLAHWLEKTGASPYAYGILVSESGDGGRSWSQPVSPHRDASPVEHGFVSFFDAHDGSVGMVWLDGRETASDAPALPAAPNHGHAGGAGAMTLRSTTLRPGAAPGADVLVDARVCDCCPTTAVRTNSGVVAAYRDRSEGEIRDVSIARLVGGRWQAGGSVHADGWRIEGCPVNGPALASAGDHVALAWFTAANEDGRAYLAFSRDGGASFGVPIRIDEGRPLGRVDVEVLPDGSAVVLWLEGREGGATILARRVRSDGRRGPATVVANVSADRSSGHPRVVRSGSQLYFAWKENAPVNRVVAAIADVPPDAIR
jgi:hypothetical protein